MLIRGTCFFDIGLLDYNHIDGFLTCSIDIKDIINYVIPWDIDYKNEHTQSKHSSDFYIWQQWLLQA